jgi:hypothetical protein
MSKRLSALLLTMITMGIYPIEQYKHNLPKVDENIINPPQSEDIKKLILKKAEEKRLRKNNRRIKNG